jgi:hypothetical protein
MADPKKISDELRRIAGKLASSKTPSLSLVRRDLNRVLLAVSKPNYVARIGHIAQEIIRIAQEEAEVSLWNTDAGHDVESAMEFAKGRGEDPEQLEHALKGVKRDIDSFVEELKGGASTPKKPSAPPAPEVKPLPKAKGP